MSPNSPFSSSRMKLKAGFVSCSLLIVVSMLLAACGGGTPATQNKTHTLVLAATSVQFSSAGFNPFNANANADLGGLIYEPMFYADPLTGQWTSLLGTSHDFSSDGTQVTVHLRTGVKWNDGQAFSADDVVYTFNAIKQYPAADIQGVDSLLKSVTKVDDSTVLFTFNSAAYISFDTVGGAVFIIPKHIFSSLGDITKASIDGVHSVGTGPMMVEKWTADLMTLKKNPSFYNAANVKVDIIKMPVYKDNDAFKVAISNNEADWAGFFATGLQDSYIKPDPAHHHYYMAPVDMFGIFMDIRDNAQLADVNVRKGIAMGLDRTAWAVQGEDGLVPAVNQAGLLNIDGNKPYQLPQYQNLSTKADATGAKALLEQDGYTPGSDGI
ncbi:MAG: ABC transporter substrate-binding protein, partial [Ktedonobacteraceae bacterium]